MIFLEENYELTDDGGATSWRSSRMRCITFLFLAYLVCITSGWIVSYEADVYPEDAGWERVGSGGAARSLDAGSFVQVGQVTGLLDAYQRSVSHFTGAEHFFIEWRVQTDAPSSILDTSGTSVVLSAFGTDSANYHFTITDQLVRVIRSNLLPIVFVDVEPDVPHTYRLELLAEESYAWYIDGALIDLGIPAGAYPTPASSVIWGARHDEPGYTTSWDYIRYGVIPEDGSGDYDSDAEVGLDDFYFFHECLTNERLGINGGPGADAGSGCRFADFDDDTDVDLRDLATFQTTFTGDD